MEKNELALGITSVSKSFGTTVAVKNVSLNVEQGQIHGLLGPNGSGKTTLMKMILDLVTPDSGQLTVYGAEPHKDPIGVKQMIGYVPESPRLYDFLSGVEYLDFVADLHGLTDDAKKSRIGEFITALELEGRENEMIRGYSQGMKQKIAIIAALIHKPKILVLDEPLNALDPRSAKIMKNLLSSLSGEGVTTIFSTHVLEISEAICDRITIMLNGEIISEGTASELRKEANMPGSTLEEIFLNITGTGNLRDIIDALVK
jgi:ABC-2 type transport system ATP-binding protein